MSRIVHFEIPSDQPEKAIDFYSRTFGWKATRFGTHEYWLVSTGDDDKPGINGGIMKKNHPQQPVTNSIKVADLSEALKSIEANGGKVVVPRAPIPGVGYYAYFTDPDGNIMGVMQDDRNAH